MYRYLFKLVVSNVYDRSDSMSNHGSIRARASTINCVIWLIVEERAKNTIQYFSRWSKIKVKTCIYSIFEENIVSISRKEVTFKNILLYSAHALNFVHYLNILFYHCVCASGPKRGHYFAPHPIA